MSTLRTLKKLLLGETWTLPLGITITLAGSAVLRAWAPGAWPHLGAAVLGASVLCVLYVGVARSARR